MHRLQTTHWLWTSEPQVFPADYPEFGLHGRGGQLYSWYGIGQSLLMLPADVAGTWVAHWQLFSDYGDDPAVRSIVASYSTSILVNVLTALIAFRLLRQFRFSVREAVAGSAGAAVLHHAPALHPEHDGEQLHHASDADRLLLSVRLAAEGKQTGVVSRLRGARPEPADAADNGSRSCDGRIFHSARAVVRTGRWSRTLAAVRRLLQSDSTGLCVLLDH